MTPATTVRPQVLQLPTTAPLVRITAGLGSVGQKTWNLRRPVTLLGSRRPAHIVLHDPDICEAHCAIVNTGSELLIKDLHTESGTLQNKKRVNLSELQDGDVIQLGQTSIQVAIQRPNNPNPADWNMKPGDELPYFDPPCTYSLDDPEKQWVIKDPVVLVGSHKEAALCLDHGDVSNRHAVIFRFCGAPAVFDLGSRSGLFVDDQRCSLTTLHHRDILTIGPFRVQLWRVPGDETREFVDDTHEGELTIEPILVEPSNGSTRQNGASSELLSRNFSSSWTGLNTWEASSHHVDPENQRQHDTLAAWEEELEKKEAALRGKLHDLERFNEMIEKRERDVQTLAEQYRQSEQRLVEQRREIDGRIAALSKKEADLHKRETAVAQRWSRMKVMRCTQCGARIQPGQSDAPRSCND